MASKKTNKANAAKKSVQKITPEQMKALLELRDAVLSDYADCEKCCNEDTEYQAGGNGVNAFEALSALRPLKELALKCR